MTAEALAMPCAWQGKGLNLITALQPADISRWSKQVRCMSRTRVLLTITTMTQIEAIELTVDLEGDGSAQARALMQYSTTLQCYLPRQRCNDSSKPLLIIHLFGIVRCRPVFDLVTLKPIE